MNVPGKKTIPRIAMVFMAFESRFVSIAMIFMTSLSFLLAFARSVEVSVKNMARRAEASARNCRNQR